MVSRRQIYGRERPNRPRLSFLHDREVRRRETTNRHALIVEHRHVELHQLDSGAKRRTLILSGPPEGQDHDEGDDSAHQAILILT